MIIIRTETNADCKAIEALTYKAFENHPYHKPGAQPTEHLIINRLREQGALSLSLVAEDNTDIIGHIAFSPIMINGQESTWYGLGPVSVSLSRQRNGIGKQLINEGVQQLAAQGGEGVVLLGSPEYYGRFGFTAHANMTYPGVPLEYFMIKPLKKHSNTVPSGVVAYHPAFED